MKLTLTNAASFLQAEALELLEKQTVAANALLENGQGAGNDYIGWVTLPSSITNDELDDIQNTANILRNK